MRTPKYATAEIERRWLVDLPTVAPLLVETPYREIEDVYIDETRLRLRKITSPDGAAVFKFCKKYGKVSELSEPITNLYLTEAEYNILSRLGGRRIRKRRYTLQGGALDIFESPLAPAVFEVEFDSEAEAERYLPPEYVRDEITHEVAYSGTAVALAAAKEFSTNDANLNAKR